MRAYVQLLVGIDPDNLAGQHAKVLYRRAMAYMGLKEWEKAERDLTHPLVASEAVRALSFPFLSFPRCCLRARIICGCNAGGQGEAGGGAGGEQMGARQDDAHVEWRLRQERGRRHSSSGAQRGCLSTLVIG